MEETAAHIQSNCTQKPSDHIQPDHQETRPRQPSFAQIPYALMDQHPDHSIWAVYACIHRHGWGSEEGCWASITTISKETGVNHHKVRRIFELLHADGWINSVERPGRTTVHYPRIHPHGQPTPAPSRKLKGSKALQKTEDQPIQDPEHHDLQKNEGPPLHEAEDEQEPINKNHKTRTLKYQYPPYPPFGGNGLPAVSSEEGHQSEGSVLASPTEQPSASALVKPTARKPSRPAQANQSAQAGQLITVWNEHKPTGWSSLACVSAKRMEVAQAFARDLGGWEAFLHALPVALANAAQDKFWSGPGHDWNSFMGYGQRSEKGHFWRFLEQQQPRIDGKRTDGSITLAALGEQLKSVPRLF